MTCGRDLDRLHALIMMYEFSENMYLKVTITHLETRSCVSACFNLRRARLWMVRRGEVVSSPGLMERVDPLAEATVTHRPQDLWCPHSSRLEGSEEPTGPGGLSQWRRRSSRWGLHPNRLLPAEEERRFVSLRINHVMSESEKHKRVFRVLSVFRTTNGTVSKCCLYFELVHGDRILHAHSASVAELYLCPPPT